MKTIWYVANNYYCPSDVDFNLVSFGTKEEVEAYLLKYIERMITCNEPENKEFHTEMNSRYRNLKIEYPDDIINQAIGLADEKDEDWKIDMVLKIEENGYTQWTDESIDTIECQPKWLVYKINSQEEINFEIGIFSSDEEFVEQYYQDYEYEIEPKSIKEWIEQILYCIDDNNSGIVVIQDFTTPIVPFWDIKTTLNSQT